MKKAIALLLALVTLLLMAPKYEATSTIYVLSRSDSAINMSDLQIGTALTSDYIKVFDMWEVHEGVISNLNLPYNYEEMRGMLTVTNDADTRMLDITITSPSAEEAAMIANEYEPVYRGNDVDGPAEHHVDGAGASEPSEPQ